MAQAGWTRKVTRIGGEAHNDDWTVSFNGREIGRIYALFDGQGVYRWKWALWIMPAGQGYSDTLPEGLETLRSRARATPGWQE